MAEHTASRMQQEMASTEPVRFHEVAGTVESVDAVWSHDPGDAVASVIPADGCVDLIVRITAAGDVNAFVHGAKARAHDAYLGRGEQLWGVRLRPGHGGPLVADGAQLARLAVRAVSQGGDLVGLEALVAEHLGALGQPPGIVRDFLARVTDGRGVVDLREVYGSAGHERALQRAARTWVGITPKAFVRIERARAACSAVREGGRLAELAVELGFSDQAHLSRETRELLGVTPRQLR